MSKQAQQSFNDYMAEHPPTWVGKYIVTVRHFEDAWADYFSFNVYTQSSPMLQVKLGNNTRITDGKPSTTDLFHVSEWSHQSSSPQEFGEYHADMLAIVSTLRAWAAPQLAAAQAPMQWGTHAAGVHCSMTATPVSAEMKQ